MPLLGVVGLEPVRLYIMLAGPLRARIREKPFFSVCAVPIDDAFATADDNCVWATVAVQTLPVASVMIRRVRPGRVRGPSVPMLGILRGSSWVKFRNHPATPSSRCDRRALEA